MRLNWWRHRSLRARLTAAATLVIAAGLSTAAVLLVFRLHVTLIGGLDDNARQRARTVVAAVEAGRLPTRVLPASGDGTDVVQIVDDTGTPVATSANVAGQRRLFTFPAGPAGLDPPARTQMRVPVGEGEATLRVVALSTGLGQHRLTVYAGLPITEVDRSIGELTLSLLVGLPAVVALLAVVGWLLVGRALRPVEALRRQTADITASDLHRRLELPAAADEIHRLGQTFNDLLARLDAATDRQRQFIADAAHELRSPLAALRTQIEVALTHPGLAGPTMRTPDLLNDVTRLSRLVDDLVRLARLDASRVLRRDLVDLDDIVLGQCRRARTQSDITIDASRVSAAQVVGDPDSLETIIRNLLDNALRHADSRIAIELSTVDTSVEVAVADDGAGIPPADRKRVFERFTRLDDARARDTGGSGLGLAIVRELTEAYGGRVWIEDNHPGARVRIRLPAA